MITTDGAAEMIAEMIDAGAMIATEEERATGTEEIVIIETETAATTGTETETETVREIREEIEKGTTVMTTVMTARDQDQDRGRALAREGTRCNKISIYINKYEAGGCFIVKAR
jgi:hypothetical protein